MIPNTIVAIATPPGRGAVGIIRVSGSLVSSIAQTLLGRIPRPRYAEYLVFYGDAAVILDQGLALYFPSPHSFTGEDVLELQGHGGPVILDRLVSRILQLGARLAQPGEFSKRAFLNGKIDLFQAEAIADLINARSEQAARAAMNSLQGDFSRKIHKISGALIDCRTWIEASIDFSEEATDFLSFTLIEKKLRAILDWLGEIKKDSRQGILLSEGLRIVLVGPPNAGKSSLLNALIGTDQAIVADVPGTTRDIIRAEIQMDGIPIQVVDTAGLHNTSNPIEQEGMKRALLEINKADYILFIVDSSKMPFPIIWENLIHDLLNSASFSKDKFSVIRNKIDLTQEKSRLIQEEGIEVVCLSARTGLGLPLLRDHLKTRMDCNSPGEGTLSARRRHREVLDRVEREVYSGFYQWEKYQALELLADHLREAHQILGEITGQFTTDDLLGEIFSNFCLGK